MRFNANLLTETAVVFGAALAESQFHRFCEFERLLVVSVHPFGCPRILVTPFCNIQHTHCSKSESGQLALLHTRPCLATHLTIWAILFLDLFSLFPTLAQFNIQHRMCPCARIVPQRVSLYWLCCTTRTASKAVPAPTTSTTVCDLSNIDQSFVLLTTGLYAPERTHHHQHHS